MASIRVHIKPHIRDHDVSSYDHFGPGEPPDGFAWVVDEFGVYVLDENGAYTVQEV